MQTLFFKNAIRHVFYSLSTLFHTWNESVSMSIVDLCFQENQYFITTLFFCWQSIVAFLSNFYNYLICNGQTQRSVTSAHEVVFHLFYFTNKLQFSDSGLILCLIMLPSYSACVKFLFVFSFFLLVGLLVWGRSNLEIVTEVKDKIQQSFYSPPSTFELCMKEYRASLTKKFEFGK